MTYDEWKTAEGPQYNPKGYVEYVEDAFCQHQCDFCDDLADLRVEIELNGINIGADYRCMNCHAEKREDERNHQ